MKTLVLPSSYNIAGSEGPDPKGKITFAPEPDSEGDLAVAATDTGTLAQVWINREQAQALIAHLTAAFKLAGTSSAHTYVRYED